METARAPANAGAVDPRPLGPPARTRDRRRSAARRALRHESRHSHRTRGRGCGVRRRAPFPLRVVCDRRPCAMFSVARVSDRDSVARIARRAQVTSARAGWVRVCRTIRGGFPPLPLVRSSFYPGARFAFPCVLEARLSALVCGFCLPRSLICPGCLSLPAPAHSRCFKTPRRRCSRPRNGVGRSHAGWRRGAGTRPRAAGWSWAPSRLARALHRSPGVA